MSATRPSTPTCANKVLLGTHEDSTASFTVLGGMSTWRTRSLIAGLCQRLRPGARKAARVEEAPLVDAGPLAAQT